MGDRAASGHRVVRRSRLYKVQPFRDPLPGRRPPSPERRGDADDLVHDGGYTGGARNVQGCGPVASPASTPRHPRARSPRRPPQRPDRPGVDGSRIDAAEHVAPAAAAA